MDDAKPDIALEFLQEARNALQEAETRLEAARDALAGVAEHAPRDALLDFALDLRDAIAGKVANAHGVAELNCVLLEFFEGFVIKRTRSWGVWPSEPPAGAPELLMQPLLRLGSPAP